MRILAAGGGSGGHVTPVLAVLNELKRHDPTVEVVFICDRPFAGQARALMSHSDVAVDVKSIYSGKLRRYHGISFWKQLLHLPTTVRNMRDVLLVGVGLVQSIWRIWRFKPDVVFTKGGFVCLPVGLAAAFMKIPLVIHDSDAHPGLTNRVLSRYATTIATGAPLENYNYPVGKTYYIGIPVDAAFKPVSEAKQRELKGKLGFPDTTRPLVVVTGGGLGARRINHAILSIAPKLLESASVLHITGRGNFHEVSERAPGAADYMVEPFIDNGMATALGAADVVVTRAGATTMLELAALAKPVVIIPNPLLTGGHQLKNAEVYRKASIILDEHDIELNPLKLLKILVKIINHTEAGKKMGKALHAFAKPQAALDMAHLIVEAVRPEQKKE